MGQAPRTHRAARQQLLKAGTRVRVTLRATAVRQQLAIAARLPAIDLLHLSAPLA